MHFDEYFKIGELIKIKKETPAIDFEWAKDWTSGPIKTRLYSDQICLILRFTKFKIELFNELKTQIGVEVIDITNWKKKTIPIDGTVTHNLLDTYFERLTGN